MAWLFDPHIHTALPCFQSYPRIWAEVVKVCFSKFLSLSLYVSLPLLRDLWSLTFPQHPTQLIIRAIDYLLPHRPKFLLIK